MTRPLTQQLGQCKNGQEFIREIHGHHAITDERWAGDHYTVTTRLGRATLCNHRRELSHGLRHRIAAGLIAIGLTGIVILITFAPIFARL